MPVSVQSPLCRSVALSALSLSLSESAPPPPALDCGGRALAFKARPPLELQLYLNLYLL